MQAAILPRKSAVALSFVSTGLGCVSCGRYGIGKDDPSAVSAAGSSATAWAETNAKPAGRASLIAWELGFGN